MRTFYLFTTDNTEGFTDGTLEIMNAEFDRALNAKLDADPEFEYSNEFASWCDNAAETISAKY